MDDAGRLGAAPTGLTEAEPAPAADAAQPPGDGGKFAGPEVPARRGSGRRDSSRSPRSVPGRLARELTGRPTLPAVSVRGSGSRPVPAGGEGLGAGLVSVPEVPGTDPATAVLDDPRVPEQKRFCAGAGCGAPVGRERGGRPGRAEGYCTRCGRSYSFVPRLRPGEVVHGQYEVVGCLAHGGLGWIYLATDRAVSDRWVVLKGLLHRGDENAMAAAIAERRFLAEIEHANIVRIYNVVEHLDARTGGVDGYTVMEYVGGRSLRQIANDRRTASGRRDPLPVDQACAFGIEALEALGHLHSRNLLYCDFKVDNAIQQDDRLKLIDLGAVRRMGDRDSALYGTIGYQAPEVPREGPSVASDLYTVARALAVLTFDFRGYTDVHAHSLPDPEDVAVLRANESFYRFLVRATDPDPLCRFATAGEMAEQLRGVLREVTAPHTKRPRPAVSTLFGPELGVPDTELLTRGPGEVSALGARPTHGRRPGGRREEARRGRVLSRRRERRARREKRDRWEEWEEREREASGGAVERPETSGSPGPQDAAAEPGPAPEPGAATAAGRGADPPAGAVVPTPPRARATALALPAPAVDAADPNAGFLAGLTARRATDLLGALRGAPVDSLELRLRELRARLETDGGDQAGPDPRCRALLERLEAEWPGDWRVVWHRGLSALARGDWEAAAHSFDAVYDAFPGESAPKLALGACAEALGQLDNAAEYYRLVWSADPSCVSAAFGLARVRLSAGERHGAVAALESVPETSIHYTAARVAAVRARLRQRSPHEPLLTDLYAAADQIGRLRFFGLDAVCREELSTEVLGSALDWTLAGRSGALDPSGTGTRDLSVMLLDSTMDEEGLRSGLERSYRLLARLAPSGNERMQLVERANRFRPRTWV